MKDDPIQTDEFSFQDHLAPACGDMLSLDEDFPWHRIRRLPRK